MSIFPERSLASTSSSELALVSPGLTDEQKRQLSSVTEGYLKDHRLIGFENTRAALPVIRQCVVDGLQIRHKRENILPTDNLQAAFRRGYSDRIALIRTMEVELEGLTGEMRLEGALALPQDLVRSASRELRGSVFLPKLKAGQEVAEVSSIRRPIFRQLADYSRNRIGEDIPGSKQVELTSQQEAGLLRHLVFSWVVFGEPRLLLETEDFMTHRQVYLAEITQQVESSWKELTQLVGQDLPEATSYLKDLSVQVADLLTSVPDKPSPGVDALAIASSINSAFKALERHFLVVNPFNKLTPFSEDPKDEGRSIWDQNRTTTVEINGVTYRIPTVSTLNLAAYLIFSENPKRAHEYRTGGNRLASLTETMMRQHIDRTIPDLESEIESDKRTLESARETIIGGGVPKEEAMAHFIVLRLVQNQNELMMDEMQFVPAVRTYHSRYTDLGLDLLRRYQHGDALIGEDEFRKIVAVHYSTSVLSERALYFIKERLAKRIRSFEDMLVYENFADAMTGEASGEYSKTRFPQGLEVTVLDILSFRNKFWLDQFLKPRPSLSPEQLGIAWAGILAQEKRSIETEARAKAFYRVGKINRQRLEAEKDKILDDELNPIGRRYAHIKHLHARLEEGVVPNNETLFQVYLEKWRKKGYVKISSATHEWVDEGRITPLLKERLDPEGYLDTKHMGNPQSLLRKAQQPYGPARIVLAALSRLAPAQLWPAYPVSVYDVAHRINPKDIPPPFTLFQPGTEPVVETRRNRLMVYKRFHDWLAENGIDLGDETFKNLIKPGDMSELIKSGHVYHRLHGLEQELQTWYGNQREKLMFQVNDSSLSFYRTPPAKIIHRREFGIASKQRRLDNLKRSSARILDFYFKELSHLGLVRPGK